MSADPMLTMIATLQQQVAGLEARVRELENERRAPAPATAAPAGDPLAVHRAKERAEIIAALEEHNWNRQAAAAKLGLPRRTMYRRLIEYGIQTGDSRSGITKGEKARAKAKGQALPRS